MSATGSGEGTIIQRNVDPNAANPSANQSAMKTIHGSERQSVVLPGRDPAEGYFEVQIAADGTAAATTVVMIFDTHGGYANNNAYGAHGTGVTVTGVLSHYTHLKNFLGRYPIQLSQMKLIVTPAANATQVGRPITVFRTTIENGTVQKGKIKGNRGKSNMMQKDNIIDLPTPIYIDGDTALTFVIEQSVTMVIGFSYDVVFDDKRV